MNYDARIDTAEENGEGVPFNPLDQADEGDRRARRRLYIVAAAAIVLMTLLWFGLHRRSADDLDPGKTASQAAAVTIVVPGKATIAGTITGTGTLAARRELPVGSVGEGGQVAQVLVEPGQWVKQGQVLATIDRSVQSEQLASQSAQIQVAQADARLAQANLDRALKLVDRGFISKADVDRLTATRDAANARVRVARAQAGETQARIHRLNIVAPAAGLVLERNAEPGQVVGPSSGVLFRIAKGGEMELLAQLSEDDLAKLVPGDAAVVTPVGSDKQFDGQIWQISPVIDPKTRQGTARIALAYAPELRPGGFAQVEIHSGSVVAPMLPESAVLADNSGNYVYIVGANNKVERRNVKTGLLTPNGIAIVSGLSGNERVVQRAGAFLQPGETVNPKVAR